MRTGRENQTLLENSTALTLATHTAKHTPQTSHTVRLCRRSTTMVRRAIAETLRYAPPVLLIPRIALEPVELGGHVVRPGEVVRLSVGTANRDPIRVPEPDRFDVGRTPNKQLAFGFGVHFCLGAMLARMEIKALLTGTARRLPGAGHERLVSIARDSTERRESVSAELEAVVQRCLARTPSDRYRDARELLGALAALGPAGAVAPA